MRNPCIILLLLVSAQAGLGAAQSYFIDYVSGNDANAGTSTGTAWKRAPGMAGFAGSYSHVVGDRFVFKGGVTWPYSIFTWSVSYSGSSPTYDVYTSTNDWYTGGSWTRAILDNQSHDQVDNALVHIRQSWVIFEHFEIKNFHWSGAGFGIAIINLQSVPGSARYVYLHDLYIHDWTHGTYASGCRDDLDIFLGDANATHEGTVITNCTVDGGAPNAVEGDSSARVVYCLPTVKNTVVRNSSNAILFGSQGPVATCSYCEIGPVVGSFDSANHGNSIELVVGGDAWVHHNVIHGANGICTFFGEYSDYTYFYNNLVYDTRGTYPINLEPSLKAFIYNNTMVVDEITVSHINNAGCEAIYAWNNHFIGGSGAGWDYGGSNLVHSIAVATALGYTANNLWIPTSAGSPTVGWGTNLAITGVEDIARDVLLRSRPQGAAWDIGAYEYTGVGPPTRLRVINARVETIRAP